MTSTSCRAEIIISAGRKTRSVYFALAADLKQLQDRNEQLDISLRDHSIRFSVHTDDISSLRANVNSYLRLADASLKCIESSSL